MDALQSPHPNFESIKQVDADGVEFWSARDLMPQLGYPNWAKAEEVIGRAARACVNSGQDVDNHFDRMVKMVKVGSNTVREVRDYKLSRYGCYLIAQNGDSGKQEVALAQTYFALQTRRQELFEGMSEAEKRLHVRGEVKTHNKNLMKTAKHAGVSHFGSFNDAGYQGLYGMPLASVESRKGLKRGELLDRSGITELAANLFRITQTDEKIRHERITGDRYAAWAHNMVGGKVRQTIKAIGGTLPEDLPPERHIREIAREVKRSKQLPGSRKRKVKSP